LENQRKALSACMAVGGEMEKRLRDAIFRELKAARDSIVESIHFDNGDPRGTRHAVKRYVAGKYLGGVVSILDGKASGGSNSYEPPRKLRQGQRGGNRMIRSIRTHDIMHYGPQDRGFILRFVNSGTFPRYAAGRNVSGRSYRRNLYRLQEEGEWYRGSIAPRNFFATLGQPALSMAVERLGKIVDDEFEKLLKE